MASSMVAGKVVRPHGVKGEVAVEVLTVIPEVRFAVGAHLFEVDGARVLTVVSARPHQGRLLVQFAGVDDRSAAEGIAGMFLAGEDERPAPEGEVWTADLIGCTVTLADGTEVGPVDDVLANPAHDVLQVARPGGPPALVPYVDAIVKEVDMGARRIVIDPPEGLLEA